MKNDKTYVLMSGWARSGAALTSSMINAHTEASFSVDVVKYFNFCYPRYPFLNQESLIIMLQEMQLRLKARFSIDLDFDYCMQVIGKNISHPHVYKVLMDHIVNQNSHGKIIVESLIASGCEVYVDKNINRLFKNKLKKAKYFNRASGFFNAAIGRVSWYRPNIDL